MKKYIKHFKWFIITSAEFMNKTKTWIVLHGIFKAHKFSKSMCKYDKLTPEQKLNWYVNEDKHIYWEV